jgi:hypothetical protein
MSAFKKGQRIICDRDLFMSAGNSRDAGKRCFSAGQEYRIATDSEYGMCLVDDLGCNHWLGVVGHGESWARHFRPAHFEAIALKLEDDEHIRRMACLALGFNEKWTPYWASDHRRLEGAIRGIRWAMENRL